jgi:hypothetical protein
MSNRLLKDTGEALFGPRWQTDLAKALDVTDRTIRGWASGERDMPTGVATDLWRLCEERSAVLDGLIDRLKIASTP